MKFALQVAGVSAIMLAIIAKLLVFGFSDFTAEPWDAAWQAPLWRGVARLTFSFIMISGTVLLGGLLIRALGRMRK